MPRLVATTIPKPDDLAILQGVKEAITAGLPVHDAAQVARIGEQTFRDWYRLGSEQLATTDSCTEQLAKELGPRALFAWTVKEAQLAMVQQNIKHIQRDASQKGGWTAAMTLLERRRPKDFGRNQQITVESTVTYVHELGPGAEAAILARRQELDSLQGGTETDTGGLPALPPAQQPDAPHTAENQP